MAAMIPDYFEAQPLTKHITGDSDGVILSVDLSVRISETRVICND